MAAVGGRGLFKLLDKLSAKRLIDSVDTVLTDCDGVIYLGNRAVPGTANVVHKLKKLGKRFFYITNNSAKTRKEYVKKLTDLGFPATEDDVVGTGYVAAVTLQQKLKYTGKAYVLGSSSLAAELSQVGITAIGAGPDTTPFSEIENITLDEEVRCVVSGYDTDINYAKVTKAVSYLRTPGCWFISTNTDTGLPHGGSVFLPGSGAILAMVQAASHRTPDIICGKPYKPMIDVIVNKYNIDPKKTLMIGDRLDTDMLLAGRCGLQSLLVLTGFSTLQEVDMKRSSSSDDDHKQVPDFYLPSLADLAPLLD